MSEFQDTYNAKFFSHIPADWNVEPLKGLVMPGKKITYGIVQPGEHDPDGYLLIRGQDYMKGWVDKKKFFRVSPALHSKFKRSTTSAGDVLLSIAGYTGSVAVVPHWIKEANLTQTTARITCDPQKLDGLYLSYFLQSDDGRLQSRRYTKGSAQEGLNLEDIERFLVSLPPLAEQKKIATTLSSVDDVIEKTRVQINKLKDLKTGMMQDLLTKGIGHTEFKDSPMGRIPSDWKVTNLASVVIPKGLQTGPFGSQLHAHEYIEWGIPVVMPKDMKKNRIDPASIAHISEDKAAALSKHRVQAGDLLFARRGDIGRFALVEKNNEGWVCGTGCLKARLLPTVNPVFMSCYLTLTPVIDWLNTNAVGQTMLNLNTSILGDLPVVLPSTREQSLIGEAIAALDFKVKKATEKLTSLYNVKKALMQDLLTGKVRVKVGQEEQSHAE